MLVCGWSFHALRGYSNPTKTIAYIYLLFACLSRWHIFEMQILNNFEVTRIVMIRPYLHWTHIHTPYTQSANRMHIDGFRKPATNTFGATQFSTWQNSTLLRKINRSSYWSRNDVALACWPTTQFSIDQVLQIETETTPHECMMEFLVQIPLLSSTSIVTSSQTNEVQNVTGGGRVNINTE